MTKSKQWVSETVIVVPPVTWFSDTTCIIIFDVKKKRHREAVGGWDHWTEKMSETLGRGALMQRLNYSSENDLIFEKYVRFKLTRTTFKILIILVGSRRFSLLHTVSLLLHTFHQLRCIACTTISFLLLPFHYLFSPILFGLFNTAEESWTEKIKIKFEWFNYKNTFFKKCCA